MGNFSVLCKGCGGELCGPEWVRLDGHYQEYDGYGGILGSGIGDAPCWHAACYKAAPEDLKADLKPSKHAPNQGFGPAKLEFLWGFDGDKPVEKFLPFAFGIFDTKFNSPCYCIDGKWQMEQDWLDEVENCEDGYDGKWLDDYCAATSEKEKELLCQQRQYELDKKVGWAQPSRAAQTFSSLEEAEEFLRVNLPKDRNWDARVVACQGNLEGAVLVKNYWNGQEKLEYRFPAIKQTKPDTDSNLWKARAYQLVIDYCPQIHPCAACGWPCMEGYSCTFCNGDTNEA
jgi:hypothetical protein